MTLRIDSQVGEPHPAESRLMAAQKVRVRVVGAGEITIGRLRIRPDAAVLFALMLYLSARVGQRISRTELLEFLWPGTPDAGRKHALRQLVYRLRKAGLDFDDESEFGLSEERVESDLNTLRSESWIATVPLDDIPAPSSVLAGCNATVSAAFGEWLDSVRQEANRCIRRAALRHIASGRREGRWVDVDNMARLCLSSDPLNEEATLALAEATMMSGAKAESLRILDAYLWDIGDKVKEIGLPAKLLRRRISDQPSFRLPRSGDAGLVGRAADLAWLNDQLEAPPTDSTRGVLLVGAPGIGKSALIRAFVTQIELRGWRAPEARLQPSDISRPMSLFVELLPTLLKMEGAIGAAPESMVVIKQLLQHDEPGETNQQRLQDAPAFPAKVRMAVSDLVGAIADEGPVVIVLEDLHWIDSQSLMTLEWMLEKVKGKSVLLLLSTRTESQFAVLRNALMPLNVVEWPVASLDPVASSSLFASLAGSAGSARVEAAALADQAFSLTGGNPLFIRNLAAHCGEGGDATNLPRNLRDLIRGRVNQFSQASQRVLYACAMLGRYASAARVSKVIEMQTAELLSCVEELDTLGLMGLSQEPGSLALHDLWQEELLDGLRTASKAMLHLRCGEVLEREATESRAAGIVHDAARHLAAAGAADRALALLEDSARYQLESGFAETAVESSRRALQVATQAADRARVRALHLGALQSVGDWDGIVALSGEALKLVDQDAGAPAQAFGEQLLAIEGIWRTGADSDLAMNLALERAEDATRSATERVAACQLTAQIASNSFERAIVLRAHNALREVSSIRESMSPAELAAHMVLETEGGDVRLAMSLADRFLSLERARGSTLGLARALRFAAYPMRACGEWRKAVAVLSESYEVAAKHQLNEQAAHAALMHVSVALESGETEDIEDWIERGASWASRTRLSHLQRAAVVSRAELESLRGNFVEAIELLSRLGECQHPAPHREALERRTVQLICAMGLGEQSEVRTAVDELGTQLERCRGQLFQDRFVWVFLKGLRALGLNAEASDYRDTYLAQWRRDSAAVPQDVLEPGQSGSGY
jgi:hypothetical protein